jgi:chlorite dismutase
MTNADTPRRTLSHFALAAFKDAYWTLDGKARADVQQRWLRGLRDAARSVYLYQVFPAESGADLLIWSALPVDDAGAAHRFFECFARATNPVRAYVDIRQTLWGFTRPSQYSKAQRSAQEIDPFAATRKAYLVMYPFTKTVEWYLLSRDSRQGMMNGHIKVGKQYEDISQLLLYSTGLQDQEFVVVYETDDLARFSELVGELRSSDARAYTLSDTPVHTALYHPADETLALWS